MKALTKEERFYCYNSVKIQRSNLLYHKNNALSRGNTAESDMYENIIEELDQLLEKLYYEGMQTEITKWNQ